MKQLNDFLSFLKKNRLIIYLLLGIALLLQVCSYGAKPPVATGEVAIEDVTSLPSDNSVVQIPENPTPNGNDNDFGTLMLMAIAVLGFFVAKRFGLLEKAFPRVLIFRVIHLKNKTNGNLVIKIFLLNKTDKSISFNNPSIAFFKGSQKREFVIKNIGGLNYFPLTLTPGTGQRFTIDAQKFYTNIDNLDEYKLVQMAISTTSGKTYKSIKWPTWLILRRI
ncbi:hypothetical protein E9993_16490 [Labilibacter sediminis]|nr:hypothetical protein E9993_16490 [Labilibacter sediminis]